MTPTGSCTAATKPRRVVSCTAPPALSAKAAQWKRRSIGGVDLVSRHLRDGVSVIVARRSGELVHAAPPDFPPCNTRSGRGCAARSKASSLALWAASTALRTSLRLPSPACPTEYASDGDKHRHACIVAIGALLSCRRCRAWPCGRCSIYSCSALADEFGVGKAAGRSGYARPSPLALRPRAGLTRACQLGRR